MSSEDFTYGFNQGLIAGLTQRPFVFGLGATNKRNALEFVWDIPEDNYEIGFPNPCYNVSAEGGINWGDGCVEAYQNGAGGYKHTYAIAGSYKVTIESDMRSIDTKMTSSTAEFSGATFITQISVPALPDGIADVSFCLGLPNLVHVSLAEGLSYCRGRSFSNSTTSYYGAFSKCPSIETVTIPSTLNDAQYLFYACYGLKSVTLTPGLKRISPDMFYMCKQLEFLNIPSSVTYIGQTAFAGCYALKSLTIPASVTYIGSSAFAISKPLEATYEGTKEQWETIQLGTYPFYPDSIIHCTDGDITI